MVLRRILLAIGCVLALLVAAGFALVWWQGRAAGNPSFFEREIAAFEAVDARGMPAPGGIVFTGSSSIRLWSTLEADMAPLPVIRRGFAAIHGSEPPATAPDPAGD